MISNAQDFVRSALTADSRVMPLADFPAWWSRRQSAHRFRIEEIPFADLDRWGFEKETGNLVHDSGKFFSIEGVRVRTNFGPVSGWSQPIIVQPEIGILGILVKQIGGILHFLMQAKMEPGNINTIQLAPTLQATRSNFTRVHEGRSPAHLERFVDPGRRIRLDILQSEQGARFLRKRNRNMVVETEGDIETGDDFCWLTLGQIHKLIRQDNIVNMDARTVLSCLPLSAPGDDEPLDEFARKLLCSALDTTHARHTDEAVISWFTEMKVRYELDVERIPLNEVENWRRTDREIVHKQDKYFSVMAVRVEADNREVSAWTQPLMKPREEGLVAFIAREIDGVLHFLVQAKVEPGNFDVVEMAPTVQCITGSYRNAPPGGQPPFLDYVLGAPLERVRFSTLQSEEGGRFFREANRNMLIEAGEEFPLDVPDNFIWMTLRQLKALIQYNNFLNVECRCLLASVGLV